MKIFVGCYTKKIGDELVGKGEGIYCFDFNSNNGQLKLLDITPDLNPSYLALSKNGKYLYAIEEIPIEESPKIKAYKINLKDNQPTLSLINKQDLPGSYACHLNLLNSQTHLAVAAYMSGNILLYPLGKKGRILPLSQNIQHKGKGPNLIRQESAHAHMIYPYGDKGIYAVDLGLDVAKLYILKESTGQMNEARILDINIKKGSGSRHMVLDSELDYAFVFSELSAEIFCFKIIGDKFIFLEAVASLSTNYSGTPSGAAIRMHPNGKYLYVSNRGHNSITIFRFEKITEKLILIGYKSSGGKTPREINIDPTGKWLLVANMDSDNIVVFRINQSNGMLKKNSVNNDIKTASCIQFLEY